MPFKFYVLTVALLVVTSLVSCGGTKAQTKSYRRPDLNVIPDSIFQNPSLERLDFSPGWTMVNEELLIYSSSSRNRITEVPDQICTLKKLQFLDLQMQNIRTLPDCFYQLKDLSYLDLSFNEHLDLDRFLSQSRKLSQLKFLCLFGIGPAMIDSVNIRKRFDASRTKLVLTKFDYVQFISAQSNNKMP